MPPNINYRNMSVLDIHSALGNISREELDALYGDIDFHQSFFAYHKPDKIILICFYIPVFIVAFVGNVLVLLMVLTRRGARKNTSNYFLVNLAIADILVTIFCIPPTVAENIYTLWIYGDFMCRITGFMQGIYVEASVLTIVCMAADRYLAIRHPMSWRRLCNPSRVKCSIILTWILAIVVMVPLLVVRKLDEFPLSTGENVVLIFCRENWPTVNGRKIYDLFLFVVVYIIPGTIVVILYARIGCSLWSSDQHLHRENSVVSNEVSMMSSRRNLARMMIIISLLFAMCWMPYFIVSVVLNFKEGWNSREDLLIVYQFALLLGHSNIAQNPILYCFMHKGYSTFVKNVFCHCQLRELSRQSSSNSNRSNNSVEKKRVMKLLRFTLCSEEKKHLTANTDRKGTSI